MRRNRGFFRLIALALAAILVFGEAAPAFAAGTDNHADISIRSADDLYELAKNCSLDTWSQGKTVVLESDLVLDAEDFISIPSFGGTFDGNGHTISGLNLQGSDYPAGLFGVVQRGAVVKNLTVEGSVDPAGDGDTVGGIAGINHGKLTNCAFEGHVSGSSTVGGVVGLNEAAGQLINCSFDGTVTGEHYVGGIVGWNIGSVVQCVNRGSINTTEVDVGLSLDGLEDQLNSTESVPAGTDIGGVAGFSTGIMQTCTNEGNVGYAHMGYNVGGIAGRQSGRIDGCTNNGLIRGRKDVGGVAGQMEPEVTLKYGADVLDQIWDELDVLEDLLDQTLVDAQGASADISEGMDGLSDSVGTAKDSVSDLTDAMADWADGNMEVVNDFSARVSWALNQMEPIFDDVDAALDGMETAAGQFKDALDEAEKAGDIVGNAASDLRLAMDDFEAAVKAGKSASSNLQAAMDSLKAALGDEAKVKAALSDLSKAVNDLSAAFTEMSKALSDMVTALKKLQDDGSTDKDLTGLETSVTEMTEATQHLTSALGKISTALNTLVENFDASKIQRALDQLSSAAGDMKNCLTDLENAGKHLSDAMDDLELAQKQGSVASDKLKTASATLEDALAKLRSAGEKAAAVIEELADRPALEFTPINGDVTEKGDALDDALGQLLEQTDRLEDVMAESSDVLLADFRQIVRQIGVVFDLLRQQETGEVAEDTEHFEDVSELELSDDMATSGRIVHSENTGSVEGDINVAGVVGALAIEYDFDPEDDLTESDGRSLDFKYQAAAVVYASASSGTITAKKDCAGGIVGYMDLGAVAGCEGYGTVESTGGDYVGGVAGRSASTIRDSWAKCTLSGTRYVGGIVGMGEEDSVTEGCRSLVVITDCDQYAGAVSGAETGNFTGNFFVSDELAGLGRISYEGKAEPVSYRKLVKGDNTPTPLTRLTLRFYAEDELLKEQKFSYGDSFGEEVYPEIPVKEGCYAEWDIAELDDLRFDTDVHAVYTPYITALSSESERESGRPVFYLQGDFQSKDEVDAAAVEDDGDYSGLPPHALMTRRFVEHWQISVPADGEKTHTLRYLPPEGGEESLWLYVREDGKWKHVEAEEIGSYLALEVEGTQVDFAVFTLSVAWWVWVIAVLLVAAVVIFILRRVRGGKKEKKKAKK